jgi:hypothetical protein
MTDIKLLSLAGAFSLGSMAIAVAAHADLVVVDQQGTVYTKDQKFSDDAALEVPNGARLTLKRLPDGTDHVIEGPHQGAFGSYKAKIDCSTWDLLCKFGFGDGRKDTGGGVPGGTRSGPVEPAPGGTRGME